MLAPVHRAEHQQPVAGLVTADAGQRVVVARRRRRDARPQIVRGVRALQHQRHVEHRQVDMLPAPGAPALDQRRGDREGRHRPRRVVDHRRADLDRVDLRRPGRGHDARRGLDLDVVAGLAGARPVLAERGHRAIDQALVLGREVGIAEPEPGERAGAVVLDQHVGPGGEAPEQRPAALMPEIERHRALVRRLGQVVDAHQRGVERLVGPLLAHLVGPGRVLDLDDVGPEHGQLVGGEGAGQHMGRVDHAEAVERPHGASSRLPDPAYAIPTRGRIGKGSRRRCLSSSTNTRPRSARSRCG